MWNLGSNYIGDEGARLLAGAPFKNLKELFIGKQKYYAEDNNIGVLGANHLSYNNF